MHKIFVCDCHDVNHQFIVSKIEGEEEIYIFVMLNKFSFLKRIKEAIKYIFGYKCIFGNFEEIMLDKEKTQELIKALQ